MNLRVFSRPQCLQRRDLVNQQCRQISLLYAAGAKTTLGGQEIASFTPYKFPSTGSYKINLWERKPLKHRGQWTVKHALNRFSEPGTLLRPLDLPDPSGTHFPKERLIDIPSHFGSRDPTTILGEHPNYMFKKLRITPFNITRSKLGGGIKNAHFTENTVNESYFEHMMRKVSWFLQNQRKVEISIHAKSAKRLEELIRSSPHLHPQAILRAMPEGCGIIIEPQINHSTHYIAWAMGGPYFEGPTQSKKKGNEKEKGKEKEIPVTSEPLKLRKPQTLMHKLLEFKMRVLDDIDSGKIPVPKIQRKQYQRMARLAELEREEFEAKSKLDGKEEDEDTDREKQEDDEDTDDGHIHDFEEQEDKTSTTNPTSKATWTPMTVEQNQSKTI